MCVCGDLCACMGACVHGCVHACVYVHETVHKCEFQMNLSLVLVTQVNVPYSLIIFSCADQQERKREMRHADIR